MVLSRISFATLLHSKVDSLLPDMFGNSLLEGAHDPLKDLIHDAEKVGDHERCTTT